MFALSMIGLLAAVAFVVFLIRAHPDGTPRIKSDALAGLLGVACVSVAGFALTGLVQLALG
jgi:hypothetical protein